MSEAQSKAKRGIRHALRRHWKSVFSVAALCCAAIVLVLFWPMDAQRYLRQTASGEWLDRSGRPLYVFLNENEQWCFPRSLDEIGPRLIQATIAAEDQRFFRHCGIDAVAVIRALWQNVKHRRTVSGASTLTMQVVKRRNGKRRTLWSKANQALRAIRLERRTNKEQILEAYLNSAPYGFNLVGCEAAARRFFGKPANELTLPEAALLAGLPRGPSRLNPLANRERARVRRNYVLKRMRDEGMISAREFQEAREAPLGAAWHSFPTLSPHLAMRLKPEIERLGRLRATLDTDMQLMAERLARRHVNRFKGKVTNAAVVVIDAPSASILAHIGSVDFFDTPGGGQVDACRALRSPGSALKPFTYALAMERNRLYACETLLDAPLDYGLYDPENFDREYHGLVTASEALKHSLNVPAVTVLQRVGCGEVHSFLTELGLTTLNRPPEHYGLGLTLGNCGVRLEELAAAYCMIANLGSYRPLTVLGESRRNGSKTVLSRGTCVRLFEMLEQPLPREFAADRTARVGVLPDVAWKTGTSTGYHDAWAFVFNTQYVVGVWMGNNDGRSSERLVGAEAALPLAAELFRSLPPANGPAWPAPAGDLKEVSVCAVSGLPGSGWCRQRKTALLPRGQFLNRRCDVHHPAPAVAMLAGGSPDIIERWPGGALGWDLARIPTPRIASPARRTPETPRLDALNILTPSNRAEYVLTGEPNGDCLRLETSLDETTPLHWYLDDRYLGRSQPYDPLTLQLRRGKHTLVCMTPDGFTRKVQFVVVNANRPLRFRN